MGNAVGMSENKNMRILVLKSCDALLFERMIHRVRAQFPGAVVTALAPPAMKDAIRRELADEIITIGYDPWARVSLWTAITSETAWPKIRNRFDVAVVGYDSALGDGQCGQELLALFSGAAEVYGCNTRQRLFRLDGGRWLALLFRRGPVRCAMNVGLLALVPFVIIWAAFISASGPRLDRLKRLS